MSFKYVIYDYCNTNNSQTRAHPHTHKSILYILIYKTQFKLNEPKLLLQKLLHKNVLNEKSEDLQVYVKCIEH
jgi:hypothetical protein